MKKQDLWVAIRKREPKPTASFVSKTNKRNFGNTLSLEEVHYHSVV